MTHQPSALQATAAVPHLAMGDSPDAPSSCEALSVGEPTPLAEVSPDGVSVGGVLVPWSDIEAIEWNRDHHNSHRVVVRTRWSSRSFTPALFGSALAALPPPVARILTDLVTEAQKHSIPVAPELEGFGRPMPGVRRIPR